MKKIIQVFSFLVLAFVLSCVSTAAQSNTVLGAKIPFAFNLGATSFQAGSYSFKIAKDQGPSTVITLVDSNGDNMQRIFAAFDGPTIVNKPVISFSLINGEYYLAGITTWEGGYQLRKSVPVKRRGVRITRTDAASDTVMVPTQSK